VFTAERREICCRSHSKGTHAGLAEAYERGQHPMTKTVHFPLSVGSAAYIISAQTGPAREGVDGYHRNRSPVRLSRY
jgi:hypothetical protein